MSDLTPARLAELRALVAAVGPERKLTSTAPVIALLDALLADAPDLIAAAEERDRLRAEVERLRDAAEPQPEPEDERGTLPPLFGGRANVITLCGSTRFKDEFMAVNQRLTMGGNVVISLGVFGHTDLPNYDWTTDASDLKRTLDRLHFQKIDMADEVYVVNPGGYIGESTQREIAYAEAQGKRVRYHEPITAPVPSPVAAEERTGSGLRCTYCGEWGHLNTPCPNAPEPVAAESQQDVIQRLAPTCVCPDDPCLGEDGGCTACGEMDPEWDCLRVLALRGGS